MELSLIIQLISGAVGGNIAGGLMKKASLGTLLNSIVGILGGGLGGTLLSMLGIDVASGMDIAGIIGQIASGGVGGGVLLAIVALIKKAMS